MRSKQKNKLNKSKKIFRYVKKTENDYCYLCGKDIFENSKKRLYDGYYLCKGCFSQQDFDLFEI